MGGKDIILSRQSCDRQTPEDSGAILRGGQGAHNGAVWGLQHGCSQRNPHPEAHTKPFLACFRHPRQQSKMSEQNQKSLLFQIFGAFLLHYTEKQFIFASWLLAWDQTSNTPGPPLSRYLFDCFPVHSVRLQLEF